MSDEDMESCVGCKFLYSEGEGYSNYTWLETNVKCAKDNNPKLAGGGVEAPCDWNMKVENDNWPMTSSGRCELYASGVFVELDVAGENGPADESDDDEQIQAICEHSGREPHGQPWA